jgi:hypothetical protein
MATSPRNSGRAGMLRMQYRLGLDFVAIEGGGRKERAAYNRSMRALLGAKAYRIACATR